MLSHLVLCVTDSSGESESSDDSDIEGETASALFMVNVVCVCTWIFLYTSRALTDLVVNVFIVLYIHFL